MQEEDYDELEWFHFGSTGKAKVDKSAYIDGRYYHFNADGIMDDDWYDNMASIIYNLASLGISSLCNIIVRYLLTIPIC